MESGQYETVTALCEAAKVDRSVYYDALKSKDFVGALFNGSQALIYSAIPKIVSKMVEQAKDGSAIHQQTLLKMLNLYQDSPLVVQNTQNNYYEITPEQELEEALDVLSVSSGKSVEDIKKWAKL